MEDNKIIFTDEDGKEREFELLFTFDSEETSKSYAVLATEDENGELEVIAAIYNPNEEDEIGELFPIEDESEWEMVEKTIDAFFEETEE
jgi:uncharacterized protein YrzB (UPF0473 family)